jgi:hypothetical protein
MAYQIANTCLIYEIRKAQIARTGYTRDRSSVALRASLSGRIRLNCFPYPTAFNRRTAKVQPKSTPKRMNDAIDIKNFRAIKTAWLLRRFGAGGGTRTRTELALQRILSPSHIPARLAPSHKIQANKAFRAGPLCRLSRFRP